MAVNIIRDASVESERDENYSLIRHSIKYQVRGASNLEEAMRLVHDQSPTSVDAMTYSGVAYEDALPGNSGYIIKANYKKQDSGASASVSSSFVSCNFDCSTSTVHVTSLKAPVNPYGHKDAEPLYAQQTKIGWNGKDGDDADWAGVDICSPVTRESYTMQIRRSRLSTAWKRNIAKLTGTVNKSTFKGWAAGEVLFLGASYSDGDPKAEYITVSFNFAIQPNTKATIAGITIESEGWQYEWTIPNTVPSPSNNPKSSPPEVRAVCVGDVYDKENFGILGL